MGLRVPGEDATLTAVSAGCIVLCANQPTNERNHPMAEWVRKDDDRHVLVESDDRWPNRHSDARRLHRRSSPPAVSRPRRPRRRRVLVHPSPVADRSQGPRRGGRPMTAEPTTRMARCSCGKVEPSSGRPPSSSTADLAAGPPPRRAPTAATPPPPTNGHPPQPAGVQPLRGARPVRLRHLLLRLPRLGLTDGARIHTPPGDVLTSPAGTPSSPPARIRSNRAPGKVNFLIRRLSDEMCFTDLLTVAQTQTDLTTGYPPRRKPLMDLLTEEPSLADALRRLDEPCRSLNWSRDAGPSNWDARIVTPRGVRLRQWVDDLGPWVHHRRPARRRGRGPHPLMGRPPIGPVVEVRFPSHLVTALDVIAERDGVSRAAVIRSARTLRRRSERGLARKHESRIPPGDHLTLEQGLHLVGPGRSDDRSDTGPSPTCTGPVT